MKIHIILLLCLVVTATFARRDRDGSKRKSRDGNKRINRQEASMLKVVEEGSDDDDGEEYDTVEVKRPVDEQETPSTNPCNNIRCGRGESCVLGEDEPLCVCVPQCPDEPDERFRVCSTRNVTYHTECHLDRDHCLCSRRQPGCSDAGVKKVRVDYYAACKEITECPKEEFDQFSERMRDWLYEVMNDLANEQELDQYLDLLESAGRDELHADAVMWKFCDLDIHPSDRHVSKRELMYITASIKPMEHCLVPFLTSCDSDNNKKIDLQEWGTCLGIKQNDIIDRCKDIHSRRG